MKVKDIIKDDKFNEFLGYEIEAYNKRPAPEETTKEKVRNGFKNIFR